MEEFLRHFSEIMIEWGWFGMFISAFIAGSVIPFSSELVLIGLIQLGMNPTLCILSATLGNVFGGLTCYGMGMLGNVEWIERYLKIKKEKIDKMHIFLQGKGALMGFFGFLPVIGSLMIVTLGFMRSNPIITTIAMSIGKLFRYIIIYMAFKGTLAVF